MIDGKLTDRTDKGARLFLTKYQLVISRTSLESERDHRVLYTVIYLKRTPRSA